MSTENDRKDTRKAMAYDLIEIFYREPEKTYTAEEVQQIIRIYISGTEA